ncbi:uncharacterized protein LACBIDRAFT_304279 [Laccaria bicolor S238N-H82]|uniref:Predicted protein n=1 Tax=Laccaria bicolor (strain S238N-H82 / ATCC MYA-4686) TaxID=486041 RepID=B0DLA5_LACBS|nr:uncharacterized protein LACBIDRAFT_304279 [Laccaria bicolor S238N-H82]EDR04616.1 predicted protein [Laccaria bicolor S238N-H82]|eukprot:XP_001884788.1 predicted protein [Laccaria bicolor S238N-H82]
MCTLLLTEGCGLSCFSGAVACLVSEFGGELAWFSMCTLLVTAAVACLVSAFESELAWFSMCTLLVTEAVACLVSVVGEALACLVSVNCGLSCFRM